MTTSRRRRPMFSERHLLFSNHIKHLGKFTDLYKTSNTVLALRDEWGHVYAYHTVPQSRCHPGLPLGLWAGCWCTRLLRPPRAHSRVCPNLGARRQPEKSLSLYRLPHPARSPSRHGLDHSRPLCKPSHAWQSIKQNSTATLKQSIKVEFRPFRKGNCLHMLY